MRTAVIDVGSNTARLHVASDGGTIHSTKVHLALGEAIEQFGIIPDEKLTAACASIEGFVTDAHRLGADRIDVLVTSPGRQAANGGELITRIREVTGIAARILSAEDEARLAFVGATSSVRIGTRKAIAVCDVGGGSAQIVVGTRAAGPAWIRSIDIGSMRLTTRLFPHDPPGPDAVRIARAEVEQYLADVLPPLPKMALAVGGSARAVRTLLGKQKMDAVDLARAIDYLTRTPSSELATRYQFDPMRARTTAAGAVVLEGIHRRLGVPLRVVRGGIREGATIALASRRVAA